MAKEAKTETIKLVKPHEHGGKRYEPGAKLVVSARRAKLLVDDLKKAVRAPQEA